MRHAVRFDSQTYWAAKWGAERKYRDWSTDQTGIADAHAVLSHPCTDAFGDVEDADIVPLENAVKNAQHLVGIARSCPRMAQRLR